MNVLSVWRDGTVKTLYTEVLDLASIGRLEVERATRIEFDNRLQVWRVFDQEGDRVYCSPSRAKCLEWEQQHLNWVLENE